MTDAPIRDPLVDGRWTKLWAGFFAQLVQAIRNLESGGATFTPKTTTVPLYPMTTTDFVLFVDASGGAKVETLPPAASCRGRIYHIKKIDGTANSVTLDGQGTETIDGSLSQVTTTPLFSWSVTPSDISNAWWII